MYEYHITLSKLQLTIALLGEFNLNGLRRVRRYQLEPDSRSGGNDKSHGRF
jgi:hypothetical protein